MPFISVLRVQECKYTRDSQVSSVQVNIDDIEDSLKIMVMLKKWFKYYDTYCHSVFTDTLPFYKDELIKHKKDSLKSTSLCSYMDLKYLYENIDKKEVSIDVKKD